jgi:hypothetical protein
MGAGARTPEELEDLFEDAFMLRDQEALAPLFEEEAVLVSGEDPQETRGSHITAAITVLWEHDRTYLAGRTRVFQARDTALVVAEGGIAVMRRGTDRTWRYAIALLSNAGGAPISASKRSARSSTNP